MKNIVNCKLVENVKVREHKNGEGRSTKEMYVGITLTNELEAGLYDVIFIPKELVIKKVVNNV